MQGYSVTVNNADELKRWFKSNGGSIQAVSDVSYRGYHYPADVYLTVDADGEVDYCFGMLGLHFDSLQEYLDAKFMKCFQDIRASEDKPKEASEPECIKVSPQVFWLQTRCTLLAAAIQEAIENDRLVPKYLFQELLEHDARINELNGKSDARS